MSVENDKPSTPEDAFEERVAEIVAKLVARNSLSGREAKAVQSEADKLLVAVQEVIDARVKHHTDHVKLALKVVAGCFGIFALFLLPEQTREGVGRLFVSEERIQKETSNTINQVKNSNQLEPLRAYVKEAATASVPSAFMEVAHTDGAAMVAQSIGDQVLRARLESFYSQVEGARLTRVGADVVLKFGATPSLFEAVDLGEELIGKETKCNSERVPVNTNDPVAIIATPMWVEPDKRDLSYFWFGCPGAYPQTWIRIANDHGQSEPIRIISVERGGAASPSGLPEVRLNYGARQIAARQLQLPISGRSSVKVSVVRACDFGKGDGDTSNCKH
ncbi:hypothetical protein [Pseudoxanthomonas mexicana]